MRDRLKRKITYNTWSLGSSFFSHSLIAFAPSSFFRLGSVKQVRCSVSLTVVRSLWGLKGNERKDQLTWQLKGNCSNWTLCLRPASVLWTIVLEANCKCSCTVPRWKYLRNGKRTVTRNKQQLRDKCLSTYPNEESSKVWHSKAGDRSGPRWRKIQAARIFIVLCKEGKPKITPKESERKKQDKPGRRNKETWEKNKHSFAKKNIFFAGDSLLLCFHPYLSLIWTLAMSWVIGVALSFGGFVCFVSPLLFFQSFRLLLQLLPFQFGRKLPGLIFFFFNPFRSCHFVSRLSWTEIRSYSSHEASAPWCQSTSSRVQLSHKSVIGFDTSLFPLRVLHAFSSFLSPSPHFPVRLRLDLVDWIHIDFLGQLAWSRKFWFCTNVTARPHRSADAGLFV